MLINLKQVFLTLDFVVNIMAFGRTWLLDESTFSTILISLIGNITVTRSRTWIKCAQMKQLRLRSMFHGP